MNDLSVGYHSVHLQTKTLESWGKEDLKLGGQPGLHSVSLSKIKIRNIINDLIYLVAGAEARAQPS